MRKTTIGLVLASFICLAAAAPDPVQDEFDKIVITAQAQPEGLSLVIVRTQRRDGWRRVAVVTEPWFYCSPLNRTLYVVPKGYVTDFASIPGFAKMFFPPFGDWAEAAVIHDWLYDVGEKGKKQEADRIFRVAIDEQSKGRTSSTIMYWAVSVGGGSAYRDAERRDPATWATHFVDRHGEPLEEPPFPQPTTAAWRTNFDCATLESVEVMNQLRDDYDLWLYPNETEDAVH